MNRNGKKYNNFCFFVILQKNLYKIHNIHLIKSINNIESLSQKRKVEIYK